ncbi:hypothetical protein [Aeromonas phage phiWae14]|nr:hypothetical protein [Aeromonas phage phiWae14]
MKHFNITKLEIIESVSSDAYKAAKEAGDIVVSRWDWKSLEQAEQVVELFSEKESLLAVDRGEWVSPRFDVVRMPQVGDEVSRSFNGDYYPEGTIVKISKSLQITTSTGKTFYRRKKTGTWLYSKMWGLVQGHHNKWNPEF